MHTSSFLSILRFMARSQNKCGRAVNINLFLAVMFHIRIQISKPAPNYSVSTFFAITAIFRFTTQFSSSIFDRSRTLSIEPQSVKYFLRSFRVASPGWKRHSSKAQHPKRPPTNQAKNIRKKVKHTHICIKKSIYILRERERDEAHFNGIARKRDT